MGSDAREQPGSLEDLMLHETAVAWLRLLLARSTPARPWQETREDYATRLRGACGHANEKYDVTGLCQELPQRLQKLVDQEGDRLRK